ncbi:MAG: hypothetical protein EA352_12680 [Gemmatimonadales bacterium]|nr:MAG: hypothetical protein EA352_12680 [Gemmatimonadales bacterium]
MIERALTFGPDGGLVGVLTEPDGPQAEAGRPGVLFLNSGILHRVGASRIYVQVARRLASEGFTAFRFDHAGVGDSAVRRDDGSFRDSAIREARAAMDLLAERRGVDRFILAGLCSGADMAYWAALEDPRVVGLVQIDPFVYRTRRFLLRYYLPRLVSPAAWWRSLSARTRWALGRLRPGTEDEADAVWVAPEYTRVFPPREEVARGLARLRERGVVFWVWITGDMGEHVNYSGQYRESFPEVPFGPDGLEEHVVPDADHTVTGLEHQARVVEAVADWSRRHWEPSRAGSGGGSGDAEAPDGGAPLPRPAPATGVSG